MTEHVLLLASGDPRCRTIDALLADKHTTVRALPEGPPACPWDGPAPDLLVVAAWGRTGAAAELVRHALDLDEHLSVLVLDEDAAWPEALKWVPGVAVVDGASRAEFVAARERLLERRALLRHVEDVRTSPDDPLAAAALEGASAAVRESALLLERASDRGASVVLAGETGTLRGRILRHLFAREGDLSGGGRTLLVEDVDALPPPEQARVLALLREGRRVFATASLAIRARVGDRAFRQDLYYELGGAPIETVPLRERLDDLPHLLRALGLDGVGEDAIERMRRYRWVGNLRELELVAEHALMLAGPGGLVGEEHVLLPDARAETLADGAFELRLPKGGAPLAEIEREAIRQALEASESNVAETARRLDVDRGKLRYRLRRYGLGR